MRINTASVLGLDGFIGSVLVSRNTLGVSGGDLEILAENVPEGASRETRVRVRGSLEAVGLTLSGKRTAVTLRDVIPSRMTSLDLPIALGCALGDCGQLQEQLDRKNLLTVGELSLAGDVRPVPGILPMLLAADREGFEYAVIPQASLEELEGVPLTLLRPVPVATLKEAMDALRSVDIRIYSRDMSKVVRPSGRKYSVDFADVEGIDDIVRTVVELAQQRKSILFVGHPGAGKTMLARRYVTKMPGMTPVEELEVKNIYSATGLLRRYPQSAEFRGRPFRAPHHTVTSTALLGGGTFPRPGDATLAHNGVLFLDELPEFQRNILESVQRVQQDKHAVSHCSKLRLDVVFPANFVLLGAMNPCPCGWHGSPQRRCTCSSAEISRHKSSIEGIMRSFDAVVEVPPGLFYRKNG